MLMIRRAAERGRANLGWLDSRHTFSFASYHDPRFMGYGPLRVINEDRVQPGKGFGTHAHRDMEILSYVLDGALEHRDSLGTGSVIVPHDVQRMTAGTGVEHSEFNPSKTEPVHFLQIWVLPDARGLTPGYEQRRFAVDEKLNRLRLIASHDGREESLLIHQDTDIYAAVLDAGQTLTHATDRQRKCWVQVARGAVTVNDERLETGDGAAIAYEENIVIVGSADSEILLFDMV